MWIKFMLVIEKYKKSDNGEYKYANFEYLEHELGLRA
jgi:hypothetical protein